jgi:hypothetical protein
MADFNQLREYYFNIFCHSRLDRIEMATRLFGNCDDFDSFAGWLVDNFEKTLRPIYFNCTNPEMVDGLSRLIRKTAQRGSAERGIALYQLFVESLLGCLDH